jgi:hypothetical protein
MDCLGNWGGISPTDECGICNALGATCAEYGTLSLSDNGDGTWNVEYDSPWDFGTFSFDIDDVDISNATGGAANDNGFIVTINESTIQGITFANTISKGQGILLIITINGDPSEITGITVADPVDNSGTLDFIYDDGTLETCDAGYDCLGICGGSAVVDECGVCDGGYRKIDWFIDSDGDGLGYSGDSLALCYEPTGYTSNSNDSDDDTFCPYENIVKSCDCYGNIEDCTGSCGGDATIDECGVCNGSGIPDWNCDCNGNILDECGVCGGGVEDILDCVCADGLQMDCNGHCADDLGYGAVSDCMGVCEGIAEIDTCGNCVGGDTGLEENYAMDECFVCNGDNSSCTGCMEQDADNYDIQLILNNTITRPCSDDDGNGKPDCCTYTLDAEENIMPLHFKLNQNYPNPFNPQTSISFEIPILTEVALNIYDVSGHLVYSWEKMNNNPGVYRITWDAAEYSSGIYFVTMTAGDYVDMQKLMLVK